MDGTTETPVPTATTTTEIQTVDINTIHQDLLDLKDYQSFNIGLLGVLVGVVLFKGIISRMDR